MANFYVEDIINDYLEVCKFLGKKTLTREEYRDFGHYSTTGIESLWNSWTMFIEAVNDFEFLGRKQTIKKTDKNKIVITHAFDGSTINEDCYQTLLNYCKEEKAELFVLWGKSATKNSIFGKKDYDRLIDRLCTELILEKDSSYKIYDTLIGPTQVNPLTNIEKLCSGNTNIILGSSKQYMKTLPYKRLDDPHFVYTTGTISNFEYGEKTNDKLNQKYHTFGGLVLEYNEIKKTYDTRNLMYMNGKIYDLDKWYSNKKSGKVKSTKAIILGDLHFPAEDKTAIKKSKEMIKVLNPEKVVLHDVGDFLSINHHNEHQYLSRQIFANKDTYSLREELDQIFSRLKDLTKDFKKTSFYIASSNHDDFIKKWLDEGEYPKDRVNSQIGNELYLHYLKGGNVFDLANCDNVVKSKRDDTLDVCGYQLLEHGDSGINGARGNTTAYTKLFDKAIVGHTHSPEIYQSTIHVGTLSKLEMVYNDKGGTTWAHANAVIYENGAFQLLLI